MLIPEHEDTWSDVMIDRLEDILTINQGEAGELDFQPMALAVVAFFNDYIEEVRCTTNGSTPSNDG